MVYQGGSHRADLLWHADLRLWVLLEPSRIENRYWCAFGIEDPNPVSMLSITCEINPPKEGIYRRCAGLFVKDERNNVFLAHSGKVGGGRAGIGKNAFLAHWGDDDLHSVAFPDGERHRYIVLGCISDGKLRNRLTDFVHSVARFKETTIGGEQ